MKTHLVTGGAGFLGHLIGRHLLDRGERVRLLDVWEDPSKPAAAEFMLGDVRDRQKMASALQGVHVVHHAAALVPLTKSGGLFWEVNVEGSRIVAEEAVKAGVEAFIHISSSAIFGAPQECPITETTPPQPIEIYGRGKLAGEQAVMQVCRNAGLPLIVIRPRTILGEGRLGIFQILFEWMAEGRNIYVIGDGNIKFQFIHALDLMTAYGLALDARKPGIYNVGTDRFGTLREALERLITYAKSSSRVRGLPVPLAMTTLKCLDALGLSPLAPWHYLTYHKDFYFDMDPLIRMGWKCRYSNDEMFRECYNWFMAHRETIGADSGGSPHRQPVKEKILSILKKFS